MYDFLVIGNTRTVNHIASDEICYIQAAKDYSTIVLNDGTKVLVIMQLGKIFEKIKSSLPNSWQNFYRVGRGLIINKLYLREVNLTKQELVLVDKRQEGYKNAYAAGYTKGTKDALMGKLLSVSPEVNSAETRFQLPKDDLKKLIENIKSND